MLCFWLRRRWWWVVGVWLFCIVFINFLSPTSRSGAPEGSRTKAKTKRIKTPRRQEFRNSPSPPPPLPRDHAIVVVVAVVDLADPNREPIPCPGARPSSCPAPDCDPIRPDLGLGLGHSPDRRISRVAVVVVVVNRDYFFTPPPTPSSSLSPTACSSRSYRR